MGGNNQSRQARARSEGKNRLFDSEINLYRLFGTIYCRLRRYPVGGAHCAPRQRKIIRFVGEHSDSLRAALRRLLTGRPLRWVCSPLRDNVANGNISLQTPVQVDFAIEHNLFFPSDRARACRDWLLPPMVALLHACLPVRWWIRFAAAKPRRLKRATGTFLRADAPFRACV